MSKSSTQHAVEGLSVVKSAHSVSDTVNKLETVLTEKGMTIFARVDHAAGAENAEMHLPPTQVLLFGNPQIGTPLMNKTRSLAIDLPLKVLVWEDAEGDVWLGYNDPQFLKQRHGTTDCDALFDKMAGALANFANAATQA